MLGYPGDAAVGDGGEGDGVLPVHEAGEGCPGVQQVQVLMQTSHRTSFLFFAESFCFILEL